MPQDDTRDVPFLGNDLKNQPATTGKPLEGSDSPGQADAEMAFENPPDETVGPKLPNPKLAEI